ncbi:MAG: UDPglucose--hexose-phosphate uridylyltransferase [Eubacteriales bacterium]|nr:UDPglucose--hexose-phosphate uridylyltransferase [Eubacteriales bacterium]
MGSVYHDPLTGRWLIFAGKRAKRPKDTGREGGQDGCPFCPGREEMTPPSLLALDRVGEDVTGQEGVRGWAVRVFANLFPALSPEEGDYGRHEVLVETLRHDGLLENLPVNHVELILTALCLRVAVLEDDPGIRYVQVFKNSGRAAGASLLHPHWQIVALPFLPPVPAAELARLAGGRGKCPICVFLTEKEVVERLTVKAASHFVLLSPPGARFPYEMWIVPRRHAPSFREIKAEEKKELALLLQEGIKGLKKVLGSEIAYNIVFHSLPAKEDRDGIFHWRVELFPRRDTMAGFEWGTGCYINTVLPEEAAAKLREAK